MAVPIEVVEWIVEAPAVRALAERVRHLEGEVDFLRTEQIRLSRQVHVARSTTWSTWWRLRPWLWRER